MKRIAKIGLNLLQARPEMGGAWNYIQNILRTIALLDCDYEFVAYCTDVSAELVPRQPRFTMRRVSFGSGWQPARILYEQVALPVAAYRDNLDFIHWFGGVHALISRVPAVVTLHDCVFIECASEIPLVKRLYLSRMVRAACKRARVVAAISKSTGESAVRLLGVEPERIVVVPNPVDQKYRPASVEDVQRFRQQVALPLEFWLYVAHPYAHKNHARLLAAYRRLRDSGGCSWPLVLRGDRIGEWAHLQKVARDLGIEADVLWLPWLSPEDMVRLYSAASAMIFPSLYEGCGIPVLEAMACGCPVVASNIATTQEFAGGAAVVFNPESVEEMSEVMRRFSGALELRGKCRAAGIAQAQKYSPEVVAQRLMDVYGRALAARRGKCAVA